MPSASLRNLSVSDSSSQPNQILVMPKLGFRWRVTFFQFGKINSPTSSLAITRQVISCGRPKVDFSNIELNVYNSVINLAGKYKWGSITMKIRDAADGSVSMAIGDQISKQLDFSNMASAAAGVDYKFKTTIEVLDGNNGSANPGILETWNLYGCYIQSTTYDEMNYDQNLPMSISLIMQFDNADQITKDGQYSIGGDTVRSSAGDGVNA